MKILACTKIPCKILRNFVPEFMQLVFKTTIMQYNIQLCVIKSEFSWNIVLLRVNFEVDCCNSIANCPKSSKKTKQKRDVIHSFAPLAYGGASNLLTTGIATRRPTGQINNITSLSWHAHSQYFPCKLSNSLGRDTNDSWKTLYANTARAASSIFWAVLWIHAVSMHLAVETFMKILCPLQLDREEIKPSDWLIESNNQKWHLSKASRKITFFRFKKVNKKREGFLVSVKRWSSP